MLNLNYNLIYKLKRQLLRKTPASSPLKYQNGKLIFENLQKCEIFANTMEKQFSLNPRLNVPEVWDTITKIYLLKTKSSSYALPKEVWDIIKTLPNRKASGIEKMNNIAPTYPNKLL
jgi:hypothetical protein